MKKRLDQEIAIKSLGRIGAGAGLALGLRVLAGLREDYRFRYYLIGGSDDWPAVREMLSRHGLTDLVNIEEDDSCEGALRHLASTDIALCLHEDSRGAPLSGDGPTSVYGRLGQVMRAGVCAVVFDKGWPASLPGDTVVRIDDDEYAERLLRAYLERLMQDADLRRRIGASARLYMRERARFVPAKEERRSLAPADSGSNGRFQKIEGMDYKRGAITYPDRLDQFNRHHLLTKPFYNLVHKISRWDGEGMDDDTRRQFCDFANMAVALALPTSARILDVGCGSGWLSEYFARLGYDMTGIDISPGLIEMARERVARVPYGVDHETPLRCRFIAHDIESAPLDESFDAVICYDALHHFEDERAVLAHLARMLDYGGLLFVLEGERPPSGSATEEELRAVMLEYETLESPFGREYLRALLVEHGFAIAGDYLSVNGLFERELLDERGLLEVAPEAVNYLLCKKIGAGPETPCAFDSRRPGRLRARWTINGAWAERVAPLAPLELSLEVENTGDTLWLVSRAALKGTVRVALRVLDETGAMIDEVHGVPPLPRALAPGERAHLRLGHRAPERPGRYTLKLDLVDQNICWFEQRGSAPLLLPFQVEDNQEPALPGEAV